MNIHDSIDKFVKVADPAATIFRHIDSAPWIESLEKLLPKRFPLSYCSLISRYAFPAFDAGGIHFFANTGDQSLDELSVEIFEDPNIAQVTHANCLIQFARPEGGSYDPICFDARRSANNREYPIVRLNHEKFCAATKSGRLQTSTDLSTASYPTLCNAHNKSLEASGGRVSHHDWSGDA